MTKTLMSVMIEIIMSGTEKVVMGYFYSVVCVILILIIFPKTAAAQEYYTKFADNTADTTVGMKQQYNTGIYDWRTDKTYLVYPSGRYGNYSAVNPYIRAYNHKTRTWSSEVQIDNSFADQHDNHNYPQILIDRSGYLHVFSFGHNKPIIHAKSKNPGDITSWNKKTLTLSGTTHATYPAAYTAKNGDMYILFRETISTFTPWHEPEHYIKSTDDGNTWTVHRLIDPLTKSDGYNTVYVKAIHYNDDPEGLHIIFGFHKDHNEYYNKHYYAFFSFTTNKLSSPLGKDFGPTVDRNEIERCTECLIFDYGKDIPFDLGQPYIVISTDSNDIPVIFWSHFKKKNTGYLRAKIWDSLRRTWRNKEFGSINNIIGPTNITYNPVNDTFDLYIREWSGNDAVYYLYTYQDSGITKGKQLPQKNSWVKNVADAHPEMNIAFGIGQYHGWNTPLPNGKRYVYGERNFSSSNACNISTYYNKHVWSGNTYFQYPITSPCNIYSLGSNRPSNGEMYSKLIAVKPNTMYTVSYQVKTKAVISTGTYPGSVLASEYNANAQNSDSLTDNRVHDGRRVTIEPVKGTKEWTKKSYNFTTTTNASFVRLKLFNAGWGESTGRIYFKDVKIHELTPKNRADINKDTKVNALDIGMTISKVGIHTCNIPQDMNDDCTINAADVTFVISQYWK